MSWTSDRARVAALTRSRISTDAELVSARLSLASKTPDYRFGKLIEKLSKSLAEFAPLTETQITTLKTIIEGLAQGRGAK
jgi:hypothetical protein